MTADAPTVATRAPATDHRTARDRRRSRPRPTRSSSLLERLARDVDPFDADGPLLGASATPGAPNPMPAPAPAAAAAPTLAPTPAQPTTTPVAASTRTCTGTGRPKVLQIRQPDLFEADTADDPAPASPVTAVRANSLHAGPGGSGDPAGRWMPDRIPNRDVAPALRKLGLPELLCGSPGERYIRLVLAERLRTLPAAPPLPHAAGAVLAVAGDAERALGLAADLALELDLDPGDVLLATPDGTTSLVPVWLHLANRDNAGERRRSWWRRERLTLVAIDAPFDSDRLGHGHARRGTFKRMAETWVPAMQRRQAGGRRALERRPRRRRLARRAEPARPRCRRPRS